MRTTKTAISGLIAFLIFSAVNASADTACDREVAKAEANFALAKDRFTVGEFDRSDLSAAENLLLDAQFKCGVIDRDLFCSKKRDNLNLIIDAKRALLELGFGTLLEQLDVEQQRAEHNLSCNRINKRTYCALMIGILEQRFQIKTAELQKGEATQADVDVETRKITDLKTFCLAG